MAAKNEAKVKFAADTKGFNDNIKAANNQLSSLRDELKLNEAQMRVNGESVEGLQEKQRILTAQMDAASDKTKALSDKLAVAVEIFGENSDEATKLKSQLAQAQIAELNLQNALNKCNDQLEQQEDASKDAARAADNLEQAVEDAGDAAEDADDGFTVFKGALADLASNAIQAVIGSISEFMGYLKDLPEATRELRQDMSTLTTAFDNVGLSTETATDTWKELYKVFGEDDRAVETANNIARIADNEKELADWVKITTGIWGTYQDSLPVEGLAEAAAETAKTGTVTGGLADALNWSSEAATMFAGYMSEDVVTAEDAFNEALAACSTEAERQALITETLTKLYGGAADTYRETSAAQMEAKEASAETILTEVRLAEAIEPVTTEYAALKSELLSGLLPATEAVGGSMAGTIGWMREHPAVAKIVASVVGVLSAAFATLTVVVLAQNLAQNKLAKSMWKTNKAILANPTTWWIVGITAAIVALIAIIVVVVQYWDEIVAAMQKAVEAIKVALDATVKWINESVIQPIARFFTELWENVKNAFSAAWEWFKSTPIFEYYKAVFTAIWEVISSTFNVIVELAKGTWEILKVVWGVVAGWFNTNIIQPVSKFFTTLWSGISNTAKNAWNGLKNGASQAWQGIKSVFSPVASWFKDIFGKAWEGVKNVFSKGGKIFAGITDGIASAFKKVVNAIISGINNVVAVPFKAINTVLGKIRSANIAGIKPFSNLGTISVPKIPMLAEGGILTQPTLNIAGEAGPEAVIPIDKLETYISSAIDRTMQAVNLQALATAVEDLANRPIQLSVNGREFALATATDSDIVNGNRIVLGKRGLAL